MDQLKTGVIERLKENFPAHKFSKDKLSVIHRGRFANAILLRYRSDDFDMVIKDYSHCPPFIRQLAGRLFISREMKALDHLQNIEGIARQGYLLGRYTMAYPYVHGTPLSSLKKNRKKLPSSFFRQMEKMIWEMHRQDMVHLDLRNLGNILCGDDGRPYFLDFQSSLRLSAVPRKLQPLLRGADLSAVYKSWLALCEEPLPSQKQRFLEGFNKIRKLWIFRGYPLAKPKNRQPSLSPSFQMPESLETNIKTP